MIEARALIENFWINKEADKELYFQVKRAIPHLRKFFTEQLGWRIIVNERLIKVEKIPAHAESFMGIRSFTEIRDYCILCALLIFLEDKEDDEQFLLSELVDLVEIHLKEFMDVDWTKFVQRKSLIRALQYAQDKKMIMVYEGSVDKLSGGLDHEILYENTGLSRYFASSFSRDISDFMSYEDFETEPMQNVDSDKGHYRINRIYRQLVATPVMYWSEMEDQDFLYVKNQRQWLQKYLDDHLGGMLHVHKNGAFFTMDENDCFGGRHPRDAMISELVLLLCGQIREKVLSGNLSRQYNDFIYLSREMFTDIVENCREQFHPAWSKEYREMDISKLVEDVIAYMEAWMMLKVDRGQMILYPAAGKCIGQYPKDLQSTLGNK